MKGRETNCLDGIILVSEERFKTQGKSSRRLQRSGRVEEGESQDDRELNKSEAIVE